METRSLPTRGRASSCGRLPEGRAVPPFMRSQRDCVFTGQMQEHAAGSAAQGGRRPRTPVDTVHMQTLQPVLGRELQGPITLTFLCVQGNLCITLQRRGTMQLGPWGLCPESLQTEGVPGRPPALTALHPPLPSHPGPEKGEAGPGPKFKNKSQFPIGCQSSSAK